MKLYLREEHVQAMTALQEQCAAGGDFDQNQWRHGLRSIVGEAIETELNRSFLSGFQVEMLTAVPGTAEFDAAPVIVGAPEEGAPLEAPPEMPRLAPGLKTPDFIADPKAPAPSATRARAPAREAGGFDVAARLVTTEDRQVYLQVHLTRETLKALLDVLL